MKELFRFFPEQASTFAKDVDLIYLVLCGMTLFFFVAILAAVVMFGIIYRRRSETEVPTQIHGNLFLEIFWSVNPLIICMILFGWGTWLYVKNVNPPQDAMEVFVVGKQWMWKIQHPEGPREINELHIPIDRPVKILMTSEDVIHSFFIPAFRIKKDTIPGKYTSVWFEANKPGEYHLFCAEYCGTEHSRMIGTIYAMEEADYQAWLEARVNPDGQSATGNALVDRGATLFRELRCHTCHSDADATRGPYLSGLWGSEVTLANGKTVTLDESYVRESILRPKAKMVKGYAALMPAYEGQVDEEQIIALIAYIKSLTKEGSAPSHM